ncbi:MAG: hypothetical protein WCB27_10290 [Thermoguttaceae bacterium]|jgi:hypothetical protein
MTTDQEELFGLLEALCDGVITPAEHGRLQERLGGDAAARQFYFDYLDLRLHLRQWQQTCAGEHSLGVEAADAIAPGPIVMQGPPLHAPVSAIYSPMGSFAFSYLVAALIVGLGLMIGWVYHVPNPRVDHGETAKIGPPAAPKELSSPPEMVIVGRVTGMIDCQWADAKYVTAPSSLVCLDSKYDLASGLLKITYNTGARVILQGPCTYEVESRSGGLLSLGRLTARIEKRGEGREGKGEKVVVNQRSGIGSQQSAISNLPLPSPLFTIRTPTAKITDLGTEFGVEVEKSGISRAHVFEGTVEMRAIGGGAKAISLRANESARAGFGRDGSVTLVRQQGRSSTLLREMPKSVPIALFNTGVGLKEGDADPHWQLISRSDDATFKPRPARVRVAGNAALENDPARSQWISLVGGDVGLPEDVTYVFRTTFDLSGMLPSTAVLRGKCIADDRVTAIRLNGRRLTVPLQPDGEPFIYWTEFHAKSGFVKGINVLEVDVLNAGPFTPPSQRRHMKSRMSCRVELEGEVCRDPGSGGGEPFGKPPRPAAKSSEAKAKNNS